MKSHIEANQKSGSKCLIIFYDRRLDDFEQAIKKGLAKHGLKPGEMTMLVFPRSIKACRHRNKTRVLRK